MRIVLAYDLSIEAERAAGLIAHTRCPPGTSVRIVTSPSGLGIPLSSFAGPSAARAHAERTADVIASEQARIAADLRKEDLIVETVVVSGRPGEAVVREAERYDADLVVAGAGRQGVIEAAVLGSVSAEIADRSPCSVLVARASRMERVMLAADGSAAATAAVGVVATWPLFVASEVRVVGVVDPASEYAREEPREPSVVDNDAAHGTMSKLDAEGFVDAAVVELSTGNRAVSAEIRYGDPRAEVIAAANDAGADLVVVGVNGEPLLRRLLLGSVARTILGGVGASVLVVRPRRPAAPEAAGRA